MSAKKDHFALIRSSFFPFGLSWLIVPLNAFEEIEFSYWIMFSRVFAHVDQWLLHKKDNFV